MTGSSCILCSFECRGTMDSDKYCTVRLQAGVRNCQPSPAPDGRRDRACKKDIGKPYGFPVPFLLPALASRASFMLSFCT